MQKINTFIVILLILLFNSCFTKRGAINRFCTTDTLEVTLHDTIRTETIRKDTAFVYKGDTITIIKDRLQIKYYRVNDTTYIEGTCKGDTIYITKSVKIPTLQPKPHPFKWWWLLFAALFGAVLVLTIKK
jgi:hypothetical protein